MKKRILPVILFSAVIGCSADWYARDADLQVNKILADRKQTTLGYEQKTPVTTQPVSPPNPKTYLAIPLTPIAPRELPPLEPVHYSLEFAPLGPPAVDKSAQTDESTNGVNTEDLQRETVERLRLGPPAFGKLAITQLDLFGAIQYAVMYSRDYQDSADNVYLAALNVTTQRHLFEPQPFAGVTGQYEVNRIPSANPNDHNTGDYRFGPQVGVTQHLPYGGSITASAAMTLLDTLHDHLGDGQSAQLALTGSIPLLRGAGMVNLDPLISAERDLVYSIRTFEDFRRSFAVQIASTYFNLLTQQENIENLRVKYISDLALTDQTRALYAAGKLSFLEVERALQTALSDENSLVDSEQAFANSLDTFKQQLGMPITQNMDVLGEDLNITIPEVTKENAVKLALKFRLDLQTAQDKIEDARRNVEDKKNGLLPDLNLTGTSRLGDDSIADSNPTIDNRRFSYSAGFDFELPIDRLTQRNEYRAAIIAFENARRGYNRTYDQVEIDVRASLGDLRNDRVTMEIQRRAIDLAQRRVDYSNELLTQGKVVARDVVESQDDLLTAQTTFNQAKAALQIAILNFLKVTGTLRLNPDAGSLATSMDAMPAGLSGEDPELRKLRS